MEVILAVAGRGGRWLVLVEQTFYFKFNPYKLESRLIKNKQVLKEEDVGLQNRATE